MKKELKDFIHLYLGCQVVFDNRITGVLVGIRPNLLTDLIVIEEMDNNTPIYKNWCSDDTKLVLRQLSDMTKEEKKEYKEVANDSGLGYNMLPEIRYDNKTSAFFNKSNPRIMVWLLSKHFDLFNLIPEKFAIDAKQL